MKPPGRFLLCQHAHIQRYGERDDESDMRTVIRSRNAFRAISSLTVIGSVVILAGCSLPGAILAGVGNATTGALGIVEGTQSSAQLATYDQTVDAARYAISDMGLTITEDGGDGEKHSFRFRDDRDAKGGVRVIRLTDSLVRLQVQVGAFGDKELGELVLARVRSALGYANPERPAVAHAPRRRGVFPSRQSPYAGYGTASFERRVLR